MEQIKMILSAASILLFSCGVLLGVVRFFRAPAEGAFLPAETAGRPSRSELAKVCMV